MATVQSRFDRCEGPGTQFKAIWSLKIPGQNQAWDEYLVCLYALVSEDASVSVVRYREDVTHEFIVASLAPDVRIDFSRDVFEQSTLSPLMPVNHAFQFKAESDEAAVSRIQVCVNSLLAGTLPPDDDPSDHWSMLFMDGVKLG